MQRYCGIQWQLTRELGLIILVMGRWEEMEKNGSKQPINVLDTSYVPRISPNIPMLRSGFPITKTNKNLWLLGGLGGNRKPQKLQEWTSNVQFLHGFGGQPGPVTNSECYRCSIGIEWYSSIAICCVYIYIYIQGHLFSISLTVSLQGQPSDICYLPKKQHIWSITPYPSYLPLLPTQLTMAFPLKVACHSHHWQSSRALRGCLQADWSPTRSQFLWIWFQLGYPPALAISWDKMRNISIYV